MEPRLSKLAAALVASAITYFCYESIGISGILSS